MVRLEDEAQSPYLSAKLHLHLLATAKIDYVIKPINMICQRTTTVNFEFLGYLGL